MLRPRLTIALDADDELLPQRLLALLAIRQSPTPTVPSSPIVFRAYMTTCRRFSTGMTALAWRLRWRCGCRFLRTRCSILPSICQGAPSSTEETGKWVVKQAAAGSPAGRYCVREEEGISDAERFPAGRSVFSLAGMLAELMRVAGEHHPGDRYLA